MIVASFILCKDLHALSGWSATRGNYFHDREIAYLPGDARWPEDAYFQQYITPAYELDDLIFLMPPFALTKHGNCTYTATWTDYANNKQIERTSRTNPANAVCRLAIALFEQGILTKEVR